MTNYSTDSINLPLEAWHAYVKTELFDEARQWAKKDEQLDQSLWEMFSTGWNAALAQPAQEPEMLTIVYQSGYHDGKKAALAGREWNFCERCGKRTNDIHTCTPPQGAA